MDQTNYNIDDLLMMVRQNVTAVSQHKRCLPYAHMTLFHHTLNAVRVLLYLRCQAVENANTTYQCSYHYEVHVYYMTDRGFDYKHYYISNPIYTYKAACRIFKDTVRRCQWTGKPMKHRNLPDYIIRNTLARARCDWYLSPRTRLATPGIRRTTLPPPLSTNTAYVVNKGIRTQASNMPKDHATISDEVNV